MPEEKASGAKVSRSGGRGVSGGARGPRVGVCMPRKQPPISVQSAWEIY